MSKLQALVVAVSGVAISVVLLGTATPRPGVGINTTLCGDLNGDDTVDVSDAVYLLLNLFRNGPPPVECAEPDFEARLTQLEENFESLDSRIGLLENRGKLLAWGRRFSIRMEGECPVGGSPIVGPGFFVSTEASTLRANLTGGHISFRTDELTDLLIDVSFTGAHSSNTEGGFISLQLDGQQHVMFFTHNESGNDVITRRSLVADVPPGDHTLGVFGHLSTCLPGPSNRFVAFDFFALSTMK